MHVDEISSAMSDTHIHEIDALAAPPEDGGVLVWPRGVDLVELARRNRASGLLDRVRLCGQPARTWLPRSDVDSPRSVTPLTFMTGHQPAFFHAGVWIKNVAVAGLASSAGGRGFFLLVDSDVPGRLAIQWPDDSGSYCRIGSARVKSHQDWQSYEHIGPTAADELALALQAVPERIHPEKESMLGTFREAFTRPPTNGRSDYPTRWIAAMQQTEKSLECRSPEYVRVSSWFDWSDGGTQIELCGASAAFVAHLLLNADQFARLYNAALARYRTRRGIKGAQHPIPDLQIEAQRIELPFWQLAPDRPRRRLWVSRSGSDRLKLMAEDAALGEVELPALLANPLQTVARIVPSLAIRPRALAQTLFARLFATDLFIHGIGGAKYDTITDDIIHAFFKIEPPAYACISATCLLPTRKFGVKATDVARQRRAARDARYNIERYLLDSERTPAIHDLVNNRRSAVSQSDRLHEARSKNREVRRRAYLDIQRLNEALFTLAPGVLERQAEAFAEIERRFNSDQVAGSREWFFALHEPERLRRLAKDVLKAVH
ncbi:MAG TPA: hypothetical protein VNT79_10305 [Phycisphaerae bacterium]|nr:hypothetical protein [Phycisphaerae bacterium]